MALKADLLATSSASREVFLGLEREHSCGICPLALLVFPHGFFRQRDLEDQLMAMFFMMEHGEMNYVYLLYTLHQEFMLRW